MATYSKMGVKQAIDISNNLSNNMIPKHNSGHSVYIEPDFKFTNDHIEQINSILEQSKNKNSSIITTINFGEGYYNNDSIDFRFRIFQNKKNPNSNTKINDNPYSYTIKVKFYINEHGERIMTFNYIPEICSLGLTKSNGIKSKRNAFVGRISNCGLSSTDLFIPSEVKFLDKEDNIHTVDIRPVIRIEYNLDTKSKRKISCNKALATNYDKEDKSTKMYLKITDNDNRSCIFNLVPQMSKNKSISFSDNNTLSSGIWGQELYKAHKPSKTDKIDILFGEADTRFVELSKSLDSIADFMSSYLVSEYINMQKKNLKNRHSLIKKKNNN